MAYVPALCSIIEQLITDDEVEEGKGPVALIMAQTAIEVQSIAKKCNKCLEYFDRAQRHKMKLVVQAYARFKHEDLEGALLNGVGILVVTPPCLERLVNNRVPLFTKNRLKIVVVDNFDIGLKRHEDLVNRMIDNFYVRRHANGNPTQLVITANQWENSLIKYCSYGKNPALFIGHYAETALYGKVNLKIIWKEKSDKMEFVYHEYLENKEYKGRRTLIVCASEEDAEDLSMFLAERLVHVSPYLEDSSEGEKQAAFHWHEPSSNEFSVLLTTDSLLGNLADCKNVQVLINFSLPDTWGRLSFRFSTFFDYYHNYVVHPKPEDYTPPTALVLMDETDSLECFPRFINFMQRTKAQISKEHLERAEHIIAEKEESRKSILLCEQFLQFGECNRPMCRDRHTLLPMDRPTPRMPKAGHVLKLLLTHVHNPSHYSARVLATHTIRETEWRDFTSQGQYMDLVFEMSTYYGNTDNVRDHGPPKKGDYCTFSRSELFQRCQILDVPKTKSTRDLNHLNVKVHIRLIDTGMIMYNIKANNLYYLPDELSVGHFPPQAIDFHLSGILPYDGDTDWDMYTLNVINKILAKYSDTNRRKNSTDYIKCTAEFVLEGHIWTTKITTVEKTHGLNQVRECATIHKILLNDKVAERDTKKQALNRIRELADIMGESTFYSFFAFPQFLNFFRFLKILNTHPIFIYSFSKKGSNSSETA